MSGRKKQAMRHGIRGFSAGVAITLLLSALAVAGVAWVYQGMTAQARWPIHWLEIDGPFERVNAERVRAGLAPFLNGSFFTVNTAQMHKTVSAMPWVARVKVQKMWPDTVQVSIVEHAPVAHWVDGYLLDAEGRKFRVPAADEIQGLPWLEGPEGMLGTVFENWKKFDDRLVRIGQSSDRLSLDPRGSWSLRLSEGTEVRLGKGDGEVFRNLDMLISSWAGLMAGQALPPLSVDLRYTNGFAVLWPQNINAVAGNYGEKN